jgi:hypothetical protein
MWKDDNTSFDLDITDLEVRADSNAMLEHPAPSRTSFDASIASLFKRRPKRKHHRFRQ